MQPETKLISSGRAVERSLNATNGGIDKFCNLLSE
jgi:hypothetical protein